jgi:hypothetical protein
MKQVNVTRSQFRQQDLKKSLRQFGDNAMRKTREQRQQDRVRQTAYSIATADATQIVSIRRCNCRWCWGVNFEYQRTDWEIDRDLNRHAAATRQTKPFNPMGGGGFVKSRDPNPDCPICLGDGEEVARVADFRKLSISERNLIAGIKIGKGGTVEEIKFHNKIDAINTFAKIDGMITEKKVIKVIDASEAELDEYFNKHGITLDHDDPELAPFIDKLTVSDAEMMDLVPSEEATDDERSEPAGTDT